MIHNIIKFASIIESVPIPICLPQLFKKDKMPKLSKLLFFVINLFCLNANSQTKTSAKTPNVIIILADDLGYGDLSCFGHPTIRTPNLDQMAAEGIRFTEFYVGGNVCTPSRAALLTGRLPVRSGMAGSEASGNVLYPLSSGGLPNTEITIADVLKGKNYQTAIIGKWHLGALPQYLPPSHGFDYYYGTPYSNDMKPLIIYRNREVVDTNPDQHLFTQRYTAEAIDFITKNKNKPFFLYYANNYPHVPLHASKDFAGTSKRGLYGDVVQELDWSVGQVLKTLKDLKIDKNTLVIFFSDNGPWLVQKENGGSAGLLYEGKGSDYEGGMRVPAIAWWPGTVKPNQVNSSIVTSMDIFPTFLNVAKADLPKDRVYDGFDMISLLTGKTQKIRDVVYYYNRDILYAVRKGEWKAHFITKPSYSKEAAVTHAKPVLYNIENDPSEKYDVSDKHPDIIEDMRKEYEKQKASVVAVPDQLFGKVKGAKKAGATED